MVFREMTDPDSAAELLEDRTTSLGPAGSRPPGALLDRRWRLAGIVGVVALALAAVVLYSPLQISVALAPATPTPSPVAVAAIPSAAPTPRSIPTPIPTPDQGPCLADRVAINAPPDRSVPTTYGLTELPPGALAAFVVEDDGNRGSVVVAGGAASGGIPQLAATYVTHEPNRGVSVSLVGWSASGATLLVRADQYGQDDVPGCSNLFLVNADGSGVTNLTDLGPGSWAYDAALAPTSGRVAYATMGGFRVIDPGGGERQVGSCDSAWQLRWTSDEERFLAICNGVDLVVVDVLRRTAVQASLPDGLYIAAAFWTDDERSITVVGASSEGTEGAPITILDFSPAALTFEQRPDLLVPPASMTFATVSPSGRWIVLQDQVSGVNTAAMSVATGVSTLLPRSPNAESYSGVPYAWASDGDTGLYAEGGVLYAINLATATLTVVGKMPSYQFAWLDTPTP